jgi:hypothetical protein
MDDSADAEFLAARDHEDWAKALDETRALSQRRLIRTEILHSSIQKCVAAYMESYDKKYSAVVQAAQQFSVDPRTVRKALSPDTHGPSAKRNSTRQRGSWSREHLLAKLADNIEIAERSGNRAAVALLRRAYRRIVDGSTSSVQTGPVRG